MEKEVVRPNDPSREIRIRGEGISWAAGRELLGSARGGRVRFDPARSRTGLAILLAAGISALPTGLSRKLGMALSLLAAYQAIDRLSGRNRKRKRGQLVTGNIVSIDPGGKTLSSAVAHSAHMNEDAIYPRIYVNRQENLRDGSDHFQVVGDMDMKARWWSVTIHNEEFDLISHAEERHSFTSFNIVPTADGHHFVIDIAPEQPPGAVNWLPCRQGESFNLVWRLYMPGAQVLDDRDGFEVPKLASVSD